MDGFLQDLTRYFELVFTNLGDLDNFSARALGSAVGEGEYRSYFHNLAYFASNFSGSATAGSAE